MKNRSIEEKRTMFFEMEEHYEHFNDKQIKDLLADEDIQALIHDMAMTKHAMHKSNPQQIDINAEWLLFAKKHVRKTHNLTKIAASIIGIIFISSISFAAVRLGLFSSFEKNKTQENIDNVEIPHNNSQKKERYEFTDTLAKTVKSFEDSISNARFLTFEDAELAEIMQQMGDYYHVKVIFKNSKNMHLRLYFKWDKKKDLQQQVRLLNSFEHINITIENQTLNVD